MQVFWKLHFVPRQPPELPVSSTFTSSNCSPLPQERGTMKSAPPLYPSTRFHSNFDSSFIWECARLSPPPPFLLHRCITGDVKHSKQNGRNLIKTIELTYATSMGSLPVTNPSKCGAIIERHLRKHRHSVFSLFLNGPPEHIVTYNWSWHNWVRERAIGRGLVLVGSILPTPPINKEATDISLPSFSRNFYPRSDKIISVTYAKFSNFARTDRFGMHFEAVKKFGGVYSKMS